MKRVLLIVAACVVPALFALGYWFRPRAEIDDWDIATIQGQRIGRIHTTVTHAAEGGQTVVRAAQSMQMSIKRYGEKTDMAVDCRDTETPDGRLIDFNATVNVGAAPMHTTGKVVDNRLELQIESEGKALRQAVNWPVDAGGFLAPVLSLRAVPLKSGERRTVKHLNFDGQVYLTELAAEKEEDVDLWKGRARLLKVNMVEHVDSKLRNTAQDIKSAVWIDSSGNILKSLNEQLGAAFFRVTPEVASAPIEPTFDLGMATVVKVDPAIAHAHDTKWIRYRIELEGADPSAAFPTGPSQEVKRIDEHTAEVTVRAVRPDAGETKASSAADAPTPDDLNPNNFIQSDDPLIVAQAKEAAGSETDPWKQAVALEAYVRRVMANEDFFSQAFATAAEAAKTRKGDCKAHAVYLAALARALKIPARVAVGLVYVPKEQAFGGHMWTEVYVGGRWIGLDGTLGKGGIGGGHLKLSHSSMAGVAAYDVMLSMLQVIGRLKIEVLGSE
jgi:hypothetical protein